MALPSKYDEEKQRQQQFNTNTATVANPSLAVSVPPAANPFTSGFNVYATAPQAVQAAQAQNLSAPIVEQATPVNPLLFNAAENYRTLGPKDSRTEAMAQYAGALGAQRQEETAQKWANFLDTKDRYNGWLARQGINPNTIGTARLVNDPTTGRRGLDLPSLAQEEEAANIANERNAQLGLLRKAENRGYEAQTSAGLKAASEARELAQNLISQGALGSYETSRDAALQRIMAEGTKGATLRQERAKTEEMAVDVSGRAKKKEKEESEAEEGKRRRALAYR